MAPSAVGDAEKGQETSSGLAGGVVSNSPSLNSVGLFNFGRTPAQVSPCHWQNYCVCLCVSQCPCEVCVCFVDQSSVDQSSIVFLYERVGRVICIVCLATVQVN